MTAERIALFIDGPSLYKTAKALDFDVDFAKIVEVFSKRGILLKPYYYTTLISDSVEFTPLKPLMDWLAFNGFEVVTKHLREYSDDSGTRMSKGDLKVAMTVDMVELCPVVDHFVLFTGNGDFKRLVEYLQKQGKKVTIVSSIQTHQPMVSDDLRRAANTFEDLATLKSSLRRNSDDRFEANESVDEDELPAFVKKKVRN